MSKNGLLKGNNKGEADPKGTTTREQAVLMVVRAYEKFSLSSTAVATTTETGTDTSIEPPKEEPAYGYPKIIGSWSNSSNLGNIFDSNTGAFQRAVYSIVMVSFNEDGTFMFVLITDMGMVRKTGNYKPVEGPAKYVKDGKQVLLYNITSEYFPPGATTPTEVLPVDDEIIGVRYKPEDDELVTDIHSLMALKRLN